MAATFLAPRVNQQFLIPTTGLPASGAKLFCYAAGTTTKTTVYKDNAAAVSWVNPIVLDTGGNIPSQGEIWQSAGVAMKYVFAPSNDTDPPASPYATFDNITGINDIASLLPEWIAGPAPTFVSTTQFTLVGDQTATFQVGRRLKTTNTGGTVYSYISTSTFVTPTTTVTVVNDSGVLDSGLSVVSYALLSATSNSIPATTLHGPFTFNTPAAAGVPITIEGTDPGVQGPLLVLQHSSASPAAVDNIGQVRFQGKNSSAVTKTYTYLSATILDPAAGSEDGKLGIVTQVAGAETAIAEFAQGLVVGPASDKGPGTINTTSTIYQNNLAVAVPVLSTEQATTSGSTITFSGIPSTATRIRMMLVDVSVVGTGGTLHVRIGSGSLDSSLNYASVQTILTNAGAVAVGGTTSDSQWSLENVSANAATYSGYVELALENASSNRWTMSAMLVRTDTADTTWTTVGNKSISGTLDRIALVTTDTFDAGAVNIRYE